MSLSDELQDPKYADLSDTEAADLLNAKVIDSVTERFVTDRTLYAELGPELAETILTKMAGADNPMVTRALRWIETRDGLDVGHPTARAMLDLLEQSGLFTEQEALAIKAMAAIKISRADQLGLGWVYPGDVIRAREAGHGQ